jgi:hypothetical protein
MIGVPSYVYWTVIVDDPAGTVVGVGSPAAAGARTSASNATAVTIASARYFENMPT